MYYNDKYGYVLAGSHDVVTQINMWDDVDLDVYIGKTVKADDYGTPNPGKGMENFPGFDAIMYLSSPVEAYHDKYAKTLIQNFSSSTVKYIGNQAFVVPFKPGYSDDAPEQLHVHVDNVYMPSLEVLDYEALRDVIRMSLYAPKLKVAAEGSLRDNVLGELNLPFLKTAEKDAFRNAGVEYLNMPTLEEAKKDSFAYNPIQYLYLPHLVTADSSFHNTGIKDVDLPSLRCLKGNAFSHTNLTEVDFSKIKHPVDISETYDLFRSSGIHSIYIPGQTKITHGMFSECWMTHLDSSMLPDVTFVGEYAFSNNPIKDVRLENMYIDDGVFTGCELGDINIQKQFPGVTFGTKVFYDNVTSVDFGNMEDLQGTYLVESDVQMVTGPRVKTVGDGFFRDCSKLDDVRLDGIKTVGDHAFHGCSISDYTFGNIRSIGDFAFWGNKIQSLSLSNVETVGKHAFENNGMTFAYFGNLHTISDYAFANNSFSSISIDYVREIGEGAFMNNNISEIDGSDLLSLGNYAFTNNKISEVNLPKATFVGTCAFEGNPVERVTFGALEKITDGLFRNTYLIKLDAPCVTVIGNDAFYEATVDEAHFGDVTDIGDYAFYKAYLREFKFESLKSVGDYAFYGISTIYSSDVDLNQLTSLGEYAFSKTDFKFRAEMPLLKTAGQYCFAYSKVTGAICPNLTDVPEGMFKGCRDLYRADVGGKTLGAYSFYHCINLKNISFDAQIIGAHAFERCFHMMDIVLPDIREIHDYAFKEADLSFVSPSGQVRLPNLEMVGEYAFAESDLIWFDGGNCHAKAYAFADCGLKEACVGDLSFDSRYVFKDCLDLETLRITNWGYYITTEPYNYGYKEEPNNLQGCTSLKFLEITAGKEISPDELRNCPSLAEIKAPFAAIDREYMESNPMLEKVTAGRVQFDTYSILSMEFYDDDGRPIERYNNGGEYVRYGDAAYVNTGIDVKINGRSVGYPGAAYDLDSVFG